jgi:hypothetical protein
MSCRWLEQSSRWAAISWGFRRWRQCKYRNWEVLLSSCRINYSNKRWKPWYRGNVHKKWLNNCFNVKTLWWRINNNGKWQCKLCKNNWIANEMPDKPLKMRTNNITLTLCNFLITLKPINVKCSDSRFCYSPRKKRKAWWMKLPISWLSDKLQ